MSHVCYIVPGLGIGGGINVILEQSERLVKRGHRVTVLTNENTTAVDWRTSVGVDIASLHDVAAMQYVFHEIPDVIIATGWQTVYELAWRRLPARRYAYFVQAYEPDFYPPDSFEADLARATYSLPFDYLSEAKWICDHLAQTFGANVTYIRNGLNDVFHTPAESIVPRDGKFRVLLEGPLSSPRKRMTDAFLAVDDLDLEVWLVTSGGELAPWQRPHRLFRNVPLTMMPHIYAACDVIVKLPDVEGMFGPPLEMMSQGGVPVTSDVAGHEEFMRDGENGYVVAIGDWQAARDRVRELASDPDLLGRMSRAAKDTAKTFTWGPTIDILCDWLDAPDASAIGPEIWDQARLATRSYMRHYWNQDFLDSGQELHSRIHATAARITPSSRSLVTVGGWVGVTSLTDKAVGIEASDGVSVVQSSRGDRSDVLAAIPKLQAAEGFGLDVLIGTEADELASIKVGGTDVGKLKLSRKHGRSGAGQWYIDGFTRWQTREVARPLHADRIQSLEVRVRGPETHQAPRAMIEFPDGAWRQSLAEYATSRLDCSRWTVAGLDLQRFLAGGAERLLVSAPLDMEWDVYWIGVAE